MREKAKAFVPLPEKDTYIPQFAAIDPLIRRSILYFDQLAWPMNNFAPQGEQPDIEYLVSKGVLQRPANRRAGTPNAIALIRAAAEHGIALSGDAARVLANIATAHIEIFKSLEQKEPNVWSFATIGGELDIPRDMTVVRRAIAFELHCALPVPADEVPYEEILEFKHTHRNALSNLRAATADGMPYFSPTRPTIAPVLRW